jgi:hypothetical protein
MIANEVNHFHSEARTRVQGIYLRPNVSYVCLKMETPLLAKSPIPAPTVNVGAQRNRVMDANPAAPHCVVGARGVLVGGPEASLLRRPAKKKGGYLREWLDEGIRLINGK